MDKILFSSKTDNWSTPQYLFDELDQEFHFDLDVCADHNNAKCNSYFTVDDDGLSQNWFGNVWCNPPYGRGVGAWVKKAYYYNGLSVLLLAARTDTKWFHDYILGNAEIRFIKGRLKFGNSINYAPFPFMIVIFKEYI